MKVFQINTVCGSGSTGRIAVNLAKMLEKHGDESIIAYARGQAPKEVMTWKIGNMWSIYFHGIMTRITDHHGLYSKKATRKLIAKMKDYNPDIIHLHNIHGYYLNYEILFEFLKEYQRPVVWTLHDCWSYTGHCSHYTYAKCDRWKHACYGCPQKRDYPGSLLFDNSKKNFEKKKECFTSLKYLQLVTPSVWLKEQVEQSFFGNHGNIKCEVIPNGIETNIFVKKEVSLRDKWKLQDKKIILGVANVWTKQKGFDDFLRLAEQLDDSYQLVMIGVSEKQKQLILKQYKNILPLEKTKNIEELVVWYSVADIYFNSSIEETMGMTTGEAICCGTPVVVYDSTAIPESIGKNCGIIVPAKDISRVKGAIEEILENKPQYVNGCTAYREHFKEDKANNAYYNIYRESVLHTQV